MCHVMHKKNEKKLQPGGASRWRVCYQRCVPRLVFVYSKSCRASKLLYWFKSPGNFDELMQGFLGTIALWKLKPDCGESPDFFQTESDIREIIFFCVLTWYLSNRQLSDGAHMLKMCSKCNKRPQM